jgi:hypothetical protein
MEDQERSRKVREDQESSKQVIAVTLRKHRTRVHMHERYDKVRGGGKEKMCVCVCVCESEGVCLSVRETN